MDFRMCALKLYKKLGSLRKTCKLLSIAISTLSRWNAIMQPKKRVSSFAYLISKLNSFVASCINENPFYTTSQLAYSTSQAFNIKISRQRISKILKEINLTRKKARLKVIKPDTKSKVEDFKAAFNNINESVVIYSIDESGFRTDECPSYGYSKRGTRLFVTRNNGSWKHYSLLMAVNNKGKVMHHVDNKSINNQTFYQFLKDISFEPGSVILMDNVAFHKCRNIKELLHSKQCQILYTPPYSPDFNPIEYIFSTMKHRYRHPTSRKTIAHIHDIASSIPISTIANSFKHVANICREASHPHTAASRAASTPTTSPATRWS